MTVMQKLKIILLLDLGVIIIVITALRLKSLHLANSPDFVYAQTYLGLLSALGVMLNVILCSAIPLNSWRKRRSERLKMDGDDVSHNSATDWVVPGASRSSATIRDHNQEVNLELG
ncbi:hypothetical protein BCR34DRAFT_556169, partial [Clohesyomyces aquaticus]